MMLRHRQAQRSSDEVDGGDPRFVEVQGTAEGMAFTRGELDSLLALAERGLTEITALQREMVAVPPPPR